MKKRYLLTAGGTDRKGIVCRLSGILKKYNFNIEDSSMIMLRGTFSVIMLLSSAKSPGKQFEKDVGKFALKNKMTVNISPVSEKYMKEYRPKGRVCVISISGADKPGIVKVMTEILYKKGANIIDLETKSSEKVKPHAYYMFLEADVPKKVKVKTLEKALKTAGKKIGVHVSINRVDNSVL